MASEPDRSAAGGAALALVTFGLAVAIFSDAGIVTGLAVLALAGALGWLALRRFGR